MAKKEEIKAPEVSTPEVNTPEWLKQEDGQIKEAQKISQHTLRNRLIDLFRSGYGS